MIGTLIRLRKQELVKERRRYLVMDMQGYYNDIGVDYYRLEYCKVKDRRAMKDILNSNLLSLDKIKWDISVCDRWLEIYA